MDIRETVEKIEEKLRLAKGLKNIKIHIQDFEDEKDKSYIKFSFRDAKDEKRAFKLYSKWSRIIGLNCPGISIDYNNPHPLHNDNLRRIIVHFNNTQNISEKRELINKAALHFYQILKDGIKYQK